MAATFTPFDTKKPKISLGNMWAVAGNVTFDATYPAGGEVVSPGIFAGLKRVVFLISDPSPQGYVVIWDRANSKLQLRTAHGTPGATVPLLEQTTADMSATTVPVLVIGF